MTTVGFLGLGIMGRGMAGCLVEAGLDVVVWNRTPAAGAELAAAGAQIAATAAEALAADTSYSMLADDAAAAAVLSDANLAAAARRTHISMASLSPAAIDGIAARAHAAGVAFAAAPVIGRPLVAAAGRLNILVAGDRAAIEAAAVGFAAMGTRVWDLGDEPRRAAVVKIAVNYNIIHTIQAIAESMTLVEANGIAPRDFAELLAGTLFGGVAYSGYGTEIADRAYRPPAFSMQLGRKDLGLAELLAEEAGIELPTSPVLRALFDEALADSELSQDDWGAVAELTRRRLASRSTTRES